MVQSTAKKVSSKVTAANRFPLFKHRNGKWCKKCRGKHLYFTKIVDDPEGALALQQWVDGKDDWLAGRQPRGQREGLELRELANRFLTTKREHLDAHEIGQRTFNELFATCETMLATFGKSRLVVDIQADDFQTLRNKWTKTLGVHRLANEVGRVKQVFKFAVEAGLIDRLPVYGPSFVRPSAKVVRRHRAEQARKHGRKFFEAAEVRAILAQCSPVLKAMTLLAVNCGVGATDLSEMTLGVIDLDNRVLDYPRVKTGCERKGYLWAETVDAVRAALAVRPKPADKADEGKLFLTKYHRPWVRVNDDGTTDDAIAKAFAKVIKELKLTRKGRGFYSLRHTFRTIGDGARDPVAINLCMGHVDSSQGDTYREHVEFSRVRAVSEFVHAWLFAPAPEPKKATKKAASA